jgi:hypothetical protein
MPSAVALERLASAYIKAKTHVLAAGYGDEILWQRNVCVEAVTERSLLRECAWVILSSGMRESVVRLKFPAISEAFLDWASAGEIVCHEERCIAAALAVFCHERKIRAIAQCARIVNETGFHSLLARLRSDTLGVLQEFPYIGPVTSMHVAKNIGFQVAKPDRHLCRLAALSGYEHPAELCQALADYIGDPVSVVDLILWRFATLRHDYMTSFLAADPDA